MTGEKKVVSELSDIHTSIGEHLPTRPTRSSRRVEPWLAQLKLEMMIAIGIIHSPHTPFPNGLSNRSV
jgi:hypothetical protein